MHAFAANRTANGCSDDNEHHECGDEKESSDLHAEDDPRWAIIVEDFAALWWFVIPVVDDGVFVGARGVNGLVVFKAVSRRDFWRVVVLI
jgi:hypothetical protein